MNSNLCDTFSEANKIISRSEVATNNVGMKAGCRTPHTVRASPARDIKSK